MDLLVETGALTKEDPAVGELQILILVGEVQVEVPVGEEEAGIAEVVDADADVDAVVDVVEEEEGGVVVDADAGAGEALLEADHPDVVGEVVVMVRHPEDAVAEQEEDVDVEEAEVNQAGGTSTNPLIHIESGSDGKENNNLSRLEDWKLLCLVFLKKLNNIFSVGHFWNKL